MWLAPGLSICASDSRRPATERTNARTKAALPHWLAARGADGETIAAALREAEQIDEREPLAGKAIAALAAWVFDPDAKAAFLAAVGRYSADKTGRLHLGEMARRVTFHFGGGLPEAPNPGDVNLKYADGALVATAKRGDVIARIAPEQILFATYWVERTGGSSWLGISFGHVIYFPDQSFVGGALGITWSVGARAARTLVLGNREGWSVTKGEPGFYYGMVQIIGSWANMGAVARQAEIGLPDYAHELGLA